MRISSGWPLLLAIPLFQATNPSGLKITTRHTSNELSTEQTSYVQGDRKRVEYRNAYGAARWYGSNTRYGPRLASIVRCDLGQTFELNLDAAEYIAAVYPPKPLSKEQMQAPGMSPTEFVTSGEPTLRIETTTVDTGERKELFGHTARHILTTRKQIPLQGSKSEPQEMVIDGWYIDLDNTICCDIRGPAHSHTHTVVHALLAGGSAPIEKMEFVDRGNPETGFALETKVTAHSTVPLPDGTKKDFMNTSEMRVTELVEGPLDPALFSVPANFRQVKTIERNPQASLSEQWSMAWERFKANLPIFF
jgi:hypothetical protein